MADTKPATGTATVVVACKLPHGLLCRVHKETKQMQPVMGGGYREEVVWVATGEEFLIKGNSHPQNEAPRVQLTNGFALTHGIRKDWWDAWLGQNRLNPAVIAGLIFAHESEAKARDESKEKAKLNTGLERIDPNNLPREFNAIRMADEQVAKPALEEA